MFIKDTCQLGKLHFKAQDTTTQTTGGTTTTSNSSTPGKATDTDKSMTNPSLLQRAKTGYDHAKSNLATGLKRDTHAMNRDLDRLGSFL